MTAGDGRRTRSSFGSRGRLIFGGLPCVFFGFRPGGEAFRCWVGRLLRSWGLRLRQNYAAEIQFRVQASNGFSSILVPDLVREVAALKKFFSVLLRVPEDFNGPTQSLLRRLSLGLGDGQAFFGLGEIFETYSELLAVGLQLLGDAVSLVPEPTDGPGLLLRVVLGRLKFRLRRCQSPLESGDLLRKSGDLPLKSALPVNRLLQLVDEDDFVGFKGSDLVPPCRAHFAELSISGL